MHNRMYCLSLFVVIAVFHLTRPAGFAILAARSLAVLPRQDQCLADSQKGKTMDEIRSVLTFLWSPAFRPIPIPEFQDKGGTLALAKVAVTAGGYEPNQSKVR